MPRKISKPVLDAAKAAAEPMKQPVDREMCFFHESGARPTVGNDGYKDCALMTQENYCFGCQQFICSNHEMGTGAFGSHDPTAHLGDNEDE